MFERIETNIKINFGLVFFVQFLWLARNKYIKLTLLNLRLKIEQEWTLKYKWYRVYYELNHIFKAATGGQTSVLVAQMLLDQRAEGYKHVIWPDLQFRLISV